MVRKVFARWKRWLKTHRRSRKQATLQNLCCALLLAVLGAVLLRGYAADVSAEAAVRQWCGDNFFGEAEIVAEITFKGDKHQQKQVFLEKVLDNGDRYEAGVYLVRENPWKWRAAGSFYGTEPASFRLDESLIQTYGERAHIIPSEALAGMFPELAECKFLHASYSTVHIVEDEDTADNSYPAFSIYINFEYEIEDVTPEILLYESSSFRLNLETGEIEAVDFEPYILNGKEAVLWMSEERMKFIAEKLMESLPEKK